MSTPDRAERAERLRRLHHGPAILVLPNAWDAASARLIERAGFPALATTSSGVAAALGRPDGERLSRTEMVEAIGRIVSAVTCPVSADIEAGFGAALEDKLTTVRAVIEAGAVGVNLEDSRPDGSGALVAMEDQVGLLRAVRSLGDEMGVPVVVNARIDTYVKGWGEGPGRLDETVRRARAYLGAGADCVFPIALRDAPTIAALVEGAGGPVNILAGPGCPSIGELEALGVARVTFGGGLTRVALGALVRALDEVRTEGTYGLLDEQTLSGGAFRTLFD